jgi:hypothetical protein
MAKKCGWCNRVIKGVGSAVMCQCGHTTDTRKVISRSKFELMSGEWLLMGQDPPKWAIDLMETTLAEVGKIKK